MKQTLCILTLCCLLNAAATAATFPSVYEPRRLIVEEGLQILGPANDDGDDFGGQVAPLGDINGDSLMDFAIGWAEDPAGAVLVYGSRSLASAQIDRQSILSLGTLVPGRPYITGVGDFNGDGYDDWIMSNYYVGTKMVLGRSEAYPIPLDLSQLEQGQWMLITRDGVEFSYLNGSGALLPAGDINGDGYDDILAIVDDETVVILHGRSGPLPERLEVWEVADNFRSIVQSGTVALADNTYSSGDINGDGSADVLFYDFDNLYVIFGSASGLPSIIAVATLNGENGFSVVGDELEDDADRATTRSIVGYLSRIVKDITGDGVDDLLVVSRSYASGNSTKVQLLAGHRGAWTAGLTLHAPEIADGPSYEVSSICGPVRTVGDINADGVNDWMVDVCEELSVVYGRETGSNTLSLENMDGIDGFQIKSAAESDVYTRAYGANGDVNGDGLDDLLLGSPGAYLSATNLDDLIDRPFPHSDGSDRTGMLNVVFGRSELGDPASPKSLYPALGPEFIQLRWELASQQQASGFEVRRDGALVATVSGNASGYVDSTAQRDVRHTYEVLTVDDVGKRSSPLVLSAKNNLTRYPEISGEVYSSKLAEVFWVFDHLNYDIYRDGELVDSANISSWIDRDYDAAGHTYYVEAEMLLYQEHRARSPLLTLPEYADGRPPAPVDNLHFALYSGTTMELFWERANWGEEPLHYEIIRNQQTVAMLDGTSWMDYDVHLRGYEYEVTTIDASGRRSRAQQLTVSIYDELPKIRPTMPDNLSASVLDNQSIELEWVQSSIGTPATGFKIYRNGVKVGTTTGIHYVDSETALNTQYRYKVVGYNDEGQASEDAYVYASVFVPVAPAPPASASAIAYGSHTVEVFWSRVGGSTPAVSYELYRNGSLINTIDALSYMDREVIPGTDYEYSIRSVSAFGYRSDDATSASVTTR